MITLSQTEIATVGQLTSHCDLTKLDIATQEAILFDIVILCELLPLINENWASTDPIWRNLIDGSSYIGCDEKTLTHSGLKKVLAYYTYARYTLINGFNDTPNGNVAKTNPFSMPKSFRELEAFSNKYSDMGYSLMKGVLSFLCTNRIDYPLLNIVTAGCEDCGCTGGCGSESAGKGFSSKSKNVSRWDV